MRVEPLGDLLWVDGSAREFLDARTGKQVPNPTGVEFPWWVAGTADDIAYTSFLEPNLGGRPASSSASWRPSTSTEKG